MHQVVNCGCRFSPEQLGITASSAMVWLIIEIVLLLLAMYILQLSNDIRYLDLLAYCGYKYLGYVLLVLHRHSTFVYIVRLHAVVQWFLVDYLCCVGKVRLNIKQMYLTWIN